jgi:hypothetical protein
MWRVESLLKCSVKRLHVCCLFYRNSLAYKIPDPGQHSLVKEPEILKI